MPEILTIPRSASVLIVENDIGRRSWFLSAYRIPQAFVCDDCDSAIRIIRQFEPSTVFLDWDLAFGVSSEPVARFLAEMNYSGQVFVHSENPFGVDVLKRIIPAAKTAMFGQFEILRTEKETGSATLDAIATP
jgi:hypothetical protein